MLSRGAESIADPLLSPALNTHSHCTRERSQGGPEASASQGPRALLPRDTDSEGSVSMNPAVHIQQYSFTRRKK